MSKSWGHVFEDQIHGVAFGCMLLMRHTIFMLCHSIFHACDVSSCQGTSLIFEMVRGRFRAGE